MCDSAVTISHIARHVDPVIGTCTLHFFCKNPQSHSCSRQQQCVALQRAHLTRSTSCCSWLLAATFSKYVCSLPPSLCVYLSLCARAHADPPLLATVTGQYPYRLTYAYSGAAWKVRRSRQNSEALRVHTVLRLSGACSRGSPAVRASSRDWRLQCGNPSVRTRSRTHSRRRNDAPHHDDDARAHGRCCRIDPLGGA
jgi:hypothetical protein